MRSTKSLVLAALAALSLASCGGGSSPTVGANTTGARGTLVYNPPFRVGSVTKPDFIANLTAQGAVDPNAKQLLTLLTTASLLPVCGVDFHYIQYNTVGGAGETTTASGALMVPTGAPGICSGNRPIVLYAHGTAATRSYNIGNPNDPSNEAYHESGLIAAMFAAQGYIVVAPNFAGYDRSPLPYHPYLNADQQSKEMMDALSAARSALGNIPAAATLDSRKLFVTGYSAGGHPAMATVRAMQAAGATVTAAAPMSGPYALEALGDAIVFGQVDLGATEFFPLLSTSYQHAYSNLYTTATDFYALPYATGIESIFPGSAALQQQIAANNVSLAAFNRTTPVTGNATLDAALAVPANPLFAVGFGNPYLVNNSVRLAYALDVVASPDGALASSPPPSGAPLAANPMYPLRQDLKRNDLRNPLWVPHEPLLMCGGHQDPVVFFLNTQIMQAFWQPLGLPAGLVTALDVDSAPSGLTDPFALVKVGFTTTYTGLQATLGAQTAIQGYHTLVAPFCTLAAAGFFKNF
jgi:poly(3-hydroxybutyrate) depolymerase